MAYKLPNGYGSIYKLSGHRRRPWAARKTTGWKDNGQPIYAFVGFYATRAEALTALSDYNKNPYDLQAASITFSELYDKWSAEHFRKISKGSTKSYSAAFRACGKITDMKVAEIKLDHMQQAMDESGKNTPTLKSMKNLFGKMFEYAVIHEIVPPDRRELVRYLDISKPGNPDSFVRRPFSSEEIHKLWDLKDANPYISVVLIMIYSGVRIGELLNLKKDDVHLEERWFYVREAKTTAGIREVPIAEKIVPLMEYWLGRECDHLICSKYSRPMQYYPFLDHYWRVIMELVNMDHKPHDTRHTCVSLLSAAGVEPRTIRQIVGHKGQGVTEAVYTHLELPAKLEAINKI